MSSVKCLRLLHAVLYVRTKPLVETSSAGKAECSRLLAYCTQSAWETCALMQWDLHSDFLLHSCCTSHAVRMRDLKWPAFETEGRMPFNSRRQHASNFAVARLDKTTTTPPYSTLCTDRQIPLESANSQL